MYILVSKISAEHSVNSSIVRAISNIPAVNVCIHFSDQTARTVFCIDGSITIIIRKGHFSRASHRTENTSGLFLCFHDHRIRRTLSIDTSRDNNTICLTQTAYDTTYFSCIHTLDIRQILTICNRYDTVKRTCNTSNSHIFVTLRGIVGKRCLVYAVRNAYLC